MAMLEITTSNIPPALPPIGFIFKLNPLPEDAEPFLVPVIDRPDFNILQGRPPGVKQVVSGDLGITEQVASSTLDPVVSSLANPVQTVPVVPVNAGGTGNAPSTSSTIPTIGQKPTTSYGIKAPSSTTPLPKANNPAIDIGGDSGDVSKKFNFPSAGESLNASQKAFINNAVPQDSGLKSFEKMTIQSMLESQKPTLELIQILIGMLGIVEDCIARFLGTSIKIPIINLWVGIPSKNPTYTRGSLNYNDPNAKNKSYIANLNNQAINLVNPSFPKTSAFGGIPSNSTFDFPEIKDDQLAYYIGYFDEDGAQVLPPTWVTESNKWFGKIFSVPNNVQQVEQLSDDTDTGVGQLRQGYLFQQQQLDLEKAKMLDSYNRSLSLAESEADRATLTNERDFALSQFDELRASMNDGIDQQIYSEWFVKNATAQIKNLYQQPFVSTVKAVTDDKGNIVEPFQEIPKIHLKDNIEVEIPVVEAQNQLIKKTVTVDGKIKTIDAINTESNTSSVRVVKPNLDLGSDVNYFSHKKPDNNLLLKSPTTDSIKKYYVPLNIKRYFVDWNYKIVFDYEVRSIKTQKVLRTEEETVPVKINFEKDYVLRLIRVNNVALKGNTNGKPIVDKDFFIGHRTITVAGIAVDQTYYKTAKEVSLGQLDNNTGTMVNVGNNIPLKYHQNDAHNTYSPDVLDESNGLLEGEVFHGIDPRYVDPFKWKAFWLVEAIKKDDDDTIWINGKKQALPSDEKNKNNNTSAGGKQWYGLLDKFSVIGKIAGGLLPLITRKFLPLLVKIVQILTNPSKIKELVNLIIQDKLGKFFKMFNAGSTADADKLRAKKSDKGGAATRWNYKDSSGKITNVLDGKANAKILVADVGLEAKDGTVKLTDGSSSNKTKDQPILKFILNLIKMPFDIIKKIVEYFLGLIKKLMNPLTLLPTVIDFMTFAWLIDILSPTRLLGILGNVDKRLTKPDTSLENDISHNLNMVDTDTMFTEMQAVMRKGSVGGLVEVLIYHVFKNGQFVREEIEKHPIQDPKLVQQTQASPSGFDNADVSGVDVNPENFKGKFGDANNPSQKSPTVCGSRTINLNKMIPLPLVSGMPSFNKCEIKQVFLKPLQLVTSILKLIEQFINALISIPLTMLGLEPHISFPKLNFASSLDKFVSDLQNKMTQNTVPPITPLAVPSTEKNLTAQQTFA